MWFIWKSEHERLVDDVKHDLAIAQAARNTAYRELEAAKREACHWRAEAERLAAGPPEMKADTEAAYKLGEAAALRRFSYILEGAREELAEERGYPNNDQLVLASTNGAGGNDR